MFPPLLFHLSPHYGGGNEDNGDLLQKAPCSTAALRPPTLQRATTDAALTHPGHLKIPHTVQTTRATERKYKVTTLKECYGMERKRSQKSAGEATLPFTPGTILRPNTLNCS